jgi:hypothetical protein
MISWGWIISHRCSWMTVYVSCCNAQNKSHSSHHVMYMHCYAFSICQLPSCNLFTQHVIYLLWRDTSSELWTPVHSFTLIIQSTANTVSFHCNHHPLSFTANKHHFPHYTSNPLFSARPVRLTTSLYRWGKVAWLCCVQDSTLLLTPVVRPAKSQLATTFRSDFFLLLVD